MQCGNVTDLLIAECTISPCIVHIQSHIVLPSCGMQCNVCNGGLPSSDSDNPRHKYIYICSLLRYFIPIFSQTYPRHIHLKIPYDNDQYVHIKTWLKTHSVSAHPTHVLLSPEFGIWCIQKLASLWPICQ